MSASGSNMDFRKRLLQLIDSSGVSDRRLSLLATGKIDTVRNLRRGCTPRVETLQALCRVLGFRLEMVSLDVEKRPESSWRVRKEVRRDLVDARPRAGKGKGDLGSNRPE